MEERKNKECANGPQDLADLDQAFLSCNIPSLILVTKDPNYQSKLTTFIVGCVVIQIITVFHYKVEQTDSKSQKDVELIKGPCDDVLSCNRPL